MKKSKFRYVNVQVEKDLRKIKVLETPTLLKRLYLNKEISLDYYTKAVDTYYNNIAFKYKERSQKAIDFSEHKKEKRQLRDYQKTIVDYGSTFKSFAIFDEPRLGKTPAILKLIEKKELINKKIYIAAPGKVTENWVKEIEDWLGLKAQIYKGGIIKEDTKILVSTYNRVSISLKDILKWKPKTFILDEAHVLKNSKGVLQRLTKRQKERRDKTGILPINQSILKLAQAVEHRYPLTGTPTVNSPEDIFAILQLLMPNTYTSYWSFVYYYFNVKFNFMGGREVGEYKNEEKRLEIQELLDYCSTQHKQKDQMKWLKQPTITKEYIELNKEQKELEIDLIDNASIGETLILDALEQVTAYITLVTNPKTLKYIKTNNIGAKNKYILNELERQPMKNIGIFSARKQNIEVLKKIIDEKFPDRKTFILTGGSKNEDAIKIQKEVNKKNKQKGIIFLGTIGASKEGISLQGLSKAYVTDQYWIPGDMTQLFNRLNATTPENQEYFGEKEIVILHTPNTIDDIIQETLDHKKSITSMINDYKKFIEKRKGER